MAGGINAIANLMGKVDANGALLVALSGDFSGQLLGPVSATVPAYSFVGDTNTGYGSSAADTLALFAGGTTPRVTVTATAVTSGVPITLNVNGGATLVDDAANVLAQRNGTNAQKLRIYRTSTGAGLGSWIELDASVAGMGLVARGDVTNPSLSLGVEGLGDVFQWSLEGGTGHLLPATPAAYNIGSASNAVATGFINTLTMGGDVSISRGAANRLDLASGDSLNLVSGSYMSAGVAGVVTFGPAAVASITVKNGIITAIS